jgi:hypothetical protein
VPSVRRRWSFIVKPFKPDAVVATLGKVLEKED